MASDPELEGQIRTESNRALAKGAWYAMFLGLASFIPVGGMAIVDPLFIPAAAFPVVVTMFALVTHRLALDNRMHAWTANWVFIALCFTPLGFLMIHAVTLKFGAATFFFGPITISYFLVIVLSGFLLNKTLSRICGILSAVFYFAGYLVAREHLDALPLMDTAFREDLRSAPVHVIKAILMVGEGYIVGGLATTARTLIRKVRDEERDKSQINSLFGQYVSPEVREKLVRDRTGLVGERKVVAVLFADLRGFTTFSENAKPAEVVERLNQYFDRMVTVITSHGGTVDKFIGDAVMAVFGGLIPLANPATSALDAAIAMRAALVTLNREWAEKGLLPLDCGIGISYGEVLQGPIGSAHRKEFTVIGDIVNTAARLETATKELMTPVLLSDAFAAALPAASRSTLTPLGKLKLKGKEVPVTVFGTTR
jgi:adenylate cyclase